MFNEVYHNQKIRKHYQQLISAMGNLPSDVIRKKKQEAEETINLLKDYSFLIRKILSKKVDMKFLPKLLFRKDESFEYAEKIENLIKQTNK